jgi:hypothetical protein
LRLRANHSPTAACLNGPRCALPAPVRAPLWHHPPPALGSPRALLVPWVTTRELALVALLERYDDLVEPWVGPGSSGLVGVPLMPPTYTDSVRELERLLRRLREERRGLWWHVNEHYLAVSWVARTVYVRRRAKGGKHATVAERRLERQGDESDPRKVAEGVAWLAESWGLEHEPMLPELMLV